MFIKNGSFCNKGVQIAVPKNGRHILKEFIKDICGLRRYYSKKCPKITYSNFIYRVRIYNIVIVDSLIKRGMLGLKYKRTPMEDMPKEYITEYIRGFFEGGGCFVKEHKGTICISFNGSFEVLVYIQRVFHSYLGIIPKKVYSKGRSYKIQYRAKRDISKIIQFMYINADKNIILNKIPEIQ